MQPLLERLRRRLRELGQPLRDAATSGSARQPSRADAGEVPERRTELEPARPRQAAAQDPGRLPQQPPAPASTRVKTAALRDSEPGVPEHEHEATR